MEYRNLPDENIVEHCINKNPLAWAEFYARFHKLVRFVIIKNFRKFNPSLDSSHTEDILQNIFLQLWHKDKLIQIRNRSRINYWLIAVTTNATLEYISRHGKLASKLTTIDDSVSDSCSDSGYPANDIIENEKHSMLKNFIATLDNNEKVIAKMKFVFFKSNKEISEILNFPVGTVSGTLTRIKPKLKKFMKGKYE